MRILMTGASGCVGRYMVEAFLEGTQHDLVLVVRDAAKLPIPQEHRDRVTVREADIRDLGALEDVLDGIDAGILAATAWGGDDTYAVTVDANLALADRLIAGGCGHILYFATASVLTRDGGILQPAGELGSDYIRAKFQLVEGMEKRGDKARITGIYPTLVLGGRRDAPEIRFSHFANLLTEMVRHGWALRFLSAEGRFHIVHAADIATVIRHLVDHPEAAGQDPVSRLVLGNPAETVDQMMRQFMETTGRRWMRLIRLRPQWVPAIERVTPIQLSDWDRYCTKFPDQSHDIAVNPASYGLPVIMPDIASGLASIGIGRGRNG